MGYLMEIINGIVGDPIEAVRKKNKFYGLQRQRWIDIWGKIGEEYFKSFISLITNGFNQWASGQAERFLFFVRVSHKT